MAGNTDWYVAKVPPVIAMGTVTTGNTARDGSGSNFVDIYTTVATGSGGNGFRIERIQIKAIVTTTAGTVRIWLTDTGTVKKLYTEVAVSAVTVSASQPAFEQTIYFDKALKIPPGWTISATTHNSESFNVIVEGAEY